MKRLLESVFGRRQAKKRVVYTCMFGYSEPFADFPLDLDENTEAICFTDDPTLTSRQWRFCYLNTSEFGPVKTSKMVKILAHKFVGDFEESLYIDNRVKPKTAIRKFFAYLHPFSAPMITFRHPDRRCAYAESQIILDLKFDAAETVKSQMDKYRRLGFPENVGLIAGTVLLRRHNDPRVRAVMDDWFDEVQKHSYRDQLSFNFVAWRRGFRPKHFAGKLNKNHLMDWPVDKGPRLPRAFVDSTYVALNPDVTSSGMLPREHYIKVGALEGRPWC